MAILTGAGVPLGLAGLLYGLGWFLRVEPLKLLGTAGLLSSLTLGPLGALLGVMVVRRRVSSTPFRDALQVAAIVPAVVTFPVLMINPLAAPLVFLAGPLAAGVAARLWQASEPRDA